MPIPSSSRENMRSDNVKKGVEKAPSRSLLRADGLKDEDFEKPFIGIANSWNEVIPGHIHLNKLLGGGQEGNNRCWRRTLHVRGTGHLRRHRHGAHWDALFVGVEGDHRRLRRAHGAGAPVRWMGRLTNCDKITPGMLMAAGRMDVPCIMLTGGPMETGCIDDKKLSLQSVFEALGEYNAGKMDEKDVIAIESCACPGEGACAGLFTANTMACLTEALGLSLDRIAGHQWPTARRRWSWPTRRERGRWSWRAGEIRPCIIVTKDSFLNAVKLDMAIGGSTNTALHIPAIASEFGSQDRPQGVRRGISEDPAPDQHHAIRSLLHGRLRTGRWRPCHDEEVGGRPVR